MLLFHEICHWSKTYSLIEGLKIKKNGILNEVGSNKIYGYSQLRCLFKTGDFELGSKTGFPVKLENGKPHPTWDWHKLCLMEDW